MAPRKVRPIRVEGNIAYVPLTKGYEAIIDAADVPLSEGFNWMAKVKTRRDGSIKAVYAVRAEGPRSARRTFYLHRIIASTPDGMETDHRDGNGLNNRRKNLRPATPAQNRRNGRIRTNNSSGIKGVSWNKNAGKWSAGIAIGGKRRHLGYFDTQASAAAAYAAASIRLHGEFGRLK